MVDGTVLHYLTHITEMYFLLRTIMLLHSIGALAQQDVPLDPSIKQSNALAPFREQLSGNLSMPINPANGFSLFSRQSGCDPGWCMIAFEVRVL